MTNFKPYEIVLVKVGEDYRYNGQVLSFRTPYGTYMVRRVPGHPGTLEEMPESVLSTQDDKKGLHWVHYAIVAGAGSFPVDMLRYDYASPVNFRIVDINGYPKLEIDRKMGTSDLLIATCDNRRNPNWTPARWSSFGWGIRPFRTCDLRTAEYAD